MLKDVAMSMIIFPTLKKKALSKNEHSSIRLHTDSTITEAERHRSSHQAEQPNKHTQMQTQKNWWQAAQHIDK